MSKLWGARMMNVPIPPNALKFKVESGDPVVVRFDHKGTKYVMRIAQSVIALWPAGGPPLPDGTPQFSVQLAPAIVVTKESGS
jgi:hypothetical protein